MRDSRRAMTLLELLIALALTAGIAMSLLSATGMGIRLFERSQAASVSGDAIALRLQLRRWLRAASSPTLITRIGVSFEGTSQQLSFTTLQPSGYDPMAAASQITLAQDGDTFLLSIKSLDDEGGALQTLTRPLASNVQALNFAYLENLDDTPTWTPSWQERATLPMAVRITADGQTDPDWPLFLVRLIHAND